MIYWLLTTEYPPLYGGGISTYCTLSTRMLAAAGCRVTLFTQDDGCDDYEVKQADPDIRVVRFHSDLAGMQDSLGYAARLGYSFAQIIRRFIEAEGKPDIIEAQDYMGIAYYLTQYKHCGFDFLQNVPLVITLHSPAFLYLEYNRTPLYQFPDFWTCEMEKQAIAAADALIAPTAFIAGALDKECKLAGKQVAVIPNPFEAVGQPPPDYTPNRIVCYGKLSVQKGTLAVLEYMRELWDNGFEHPLEMIGGTDIVYYPDMATMGAIVQQQFGKYIRTGLLILHEKIPPSAIDKWLSSAHVIVVPSVVDNQPYVVMEAMSRGKVVLASVQGGQREMLEEGVSGFLFDHNDRESFGRQLKKILSLPGPVIKETGRNAATRILSGYAFPRIAELKLAFLRTLSPLPANRFPYLQQEPFQPLPPAIAGNRLLSVVIPFYNMGNYIMDTMAAVRNSTYQPIEILVVNDGSDDASSLATLAALEKGGENLRVLHLPHRGLAAARNAGALAATGTYLAFLDSDDKVHAAYYQKVIRALERNENVFFGGSWVQYFENSRAVWPTFTPQPPYALVHNPVNSSGLVYKKNAFLEAGLNDKETDYGMEDYESVIHMMAKGYNGIIIPEILFYYRVRTGSMFRNVTAAKLLYANRYIAKKHAAYYAAFAVPVISLLNANGPGYLYDNPTIPTVVSVKHQYDNKLTGKIKKFIKQNGPLKRLALYLLKFRSYANRKYV